DSGHRRRRDIEQVEPRTLDGDARLVGSATAIRSAGAGQPRDQAVHRPAGSPLEGSEAPAWRPDGARRAPPRDQKEPWLVGADAPSPRHEPATDEVGPWRRLRHPRPVSAGAGSAALVGHAQSLAHPTRPDAVKVLGVAREVKPA